MAPIRVAVLGLIAALALATCGLTPSRGTMPPPDAAGDVDPSAVPEFVAYAGQADRIIG